MSNVGRVLLALLLTLLASGVSPTLAADDSARVSIIRVDTSQPTWRDVYVSVADSRGLPVTGLDRDAFSVTEDGQSAPIQSVTMTTDTQVPIAFSLVMDVSGSMNDAGKLDAAKQAASQFVASLGPADSAAIISFGDSAEVIQGMTSNKDTLQAAIASLHAGGNTALYDAVAKTTLLSDALPQPFKVQLIVTDGADTASTARLSDVLTGIRNGRSVVYSIGIGGDADRSVLDQIAAAGNGQSLYSDDLSELGSTFQSVLERLRFTYVLRYGAPTTAASGQPHTVLVRVDYEGQLADAANSFVTANNAVTVDIGGVTPGETITGDRQVRATVRSGAPQRVDLLVDGTTAASSSGQPSSLVGALGPLSPGDHDLVVRVADSLGNLTVQHIPFTVAAQATPTSVATPASTAQPTPQEQQPVPPEEPSEPSEWLWAFILLVLGAAAVFFGWQARTAQPVPATMAAAVAVDDATLDLAAPEDGPTPTPQDQPVLRVDSQGQQRDVALSDVPLSIGRDADNSVVLRDLHVSRHHARISVQDGQYWIEDLKSQNGTLLNGQFPVDRHQLEPGDQFTIGSATVTYVAREAATGAQNGQAVPVAMQNS